ncbi:MAG: response regulator [Verrucomicrobiae bacterium]|nr:response regulator [Verrucomicrobiae bacterium]
MQTPSGKPASPTPEPVTIYVAEDDPHLKELTALLLESAGWSYLTFNSGEAALAAFRNAPVKPRLVISDFSMGARLINGVQFLAECKRLSPTTKAFLVSGTVEEKDIRVDGRPVDYFMSKPFKTGDFLRAVSQLLAQTGADLQPPQSRL